MNRMYEYEGVNFNFSNGFEHLRVCVRVFTCDEIRFHIESIKFQGI